MNTKSSQTKILTDAEKKGRGDYLTRCQKCWSWRTKGLLSTGIEKNTEVHLLEKGTSFGFSGAMEKNSQRQDVSKRNLTVEPKSGRTVTLGERKKRLSRVSEAGRQLEKAGRKPGLKERRD